MRHDPPTPDGADTTPGVGSPARSSADVLGTVAGAYHQVLRAMLTALLAATRAGDVPGLTGLTPGVVLELDHRLPLPVIRQLESIAAHWCRLPDTVAVFEAGLIEVADLAAVARACRRLSPPAIDELDRWTAVRASFLHDQQLLHLLADDVADRADQMRAPGWASREERRRDTWTDRVTGQQDFDGGGLIVGDLGPLSFSTVWGTVEAVAGPPSPDQPRAEQRAAALVAVCEHALSGVPAGSPMIDHAGDALASDVDDDPDRSRPGGPRRPARGQVRLPMRPRPRITLFVDLAQATGDRFAQLLRVTGLRSSPTLSARLTETLAAEAELLVQLTDRRRSLAELRAEDIPAAVRRAVIARDRGCRAPGCAAPPSQCDIHHIVPRTGSRLGDAVHDPDNLVLLCRRHHRMLDDRPWHVRLDPTSATVTWRHGVGGRARRTIPHGSRPPPRHPDDVPLAPWQAPPIPRPPRHPPDVVVEHRNRPSG